MSPVPTQRLYLQDPRVQQADATVVAVQGERVAFDRSLFYPGGGGQPPDRGSVPEDDFRRRPELLRTLDVRPPVVDGRVRVVESEGFDAQACGGTHAARTGELGRLCIVHTENKGRQNKRLYVELDAPAAT